MASSSVSQEDFDAEYELTSRRSRVRVAGRCRVAASSRPDPSLLSSMSSAGAPLNCRTDLLDCRENVDSTNAVAGPSASGLPAGLTVHGAGMVDGHDTSPKPTSRVKDKRTRPNHINKGKQQRDRRKLREKRRSTGVVHMPPTESTGGSTGDDDEELLGLTGETRKNTLYNEVLEKDKNANPSAEQERLPRTFNRRNKSPSDLDADDEDNQDYDSAVNQSDSTLSLQQEANTRTRATNGRPDTPDTESLEELLERAREENRNFLELLAEKDHKVAILQDEVSRLSRAIQSADLENEKLKEENKALLRAMSKLRVG